MFKKKIMIFRQLLQIITRECVFTANNNLVKQVEGYPVWVECFLLSCSISTWAWWEKCVPLLKPNLCRCYVDNTTTRRKRMYNMINYSIGWAPITQTSGLLLKLTQLDFSRQHLVLILMVLNNKCISKTRKSPAFWRSQIL